MFTTTFATDGHKRQMGAVFIIIYLIITGFLLYLGRNWGIKEQQKDAKEMDKNIVTQELYKK